jgi:hypothetical protein
MNCQEFEDQLQSACDQRLTPLPAALEDHAASCLECQKMWQQISQLLVAAQSLKQANHQVGPLNEARLATIVALALAQSSHNTSPTPARSPVVTATRFSIKQYYVTIAAGLVVAIGLGAIRFGWPGTVGTSGSATSIAKQQTNPSVAPTPAQPVDQPPAAQVEALVQSLAADYQSLSASTSGTLESLKLLVEPAATNARSAISFPRLLNRSTDSARPVDAQPGTNNWSDEIPILKPEVGNAFRFLWEAIPNSPNATS